MVRSFDAICGVPWSEQYHFGAMLPFGDILLNRRRQFLCAYPGGELAIGVERSAEAIDAYMDGTILFGLDRLSLAGCEYSRPCAVFV